MNFALNFIIHLLKLLAELICDLKGILVLGILNIGVGPFFNQNLSNLLGARPVLIHLDKSENLMEGSGAAVIDGFIWIQPLFKQDPNYLHPMQIDGLKQYAFFLGVRFYLHHR